MSDRTCSIEGCENPRRKRGWCSLHYNRFYRAGSIPDLGRPRTVKREPAVRFWEKVDRSGPCWLWTACTRAGYGVFTVSRGVRVSAHRFAFELLVGSIPDGKVLDHKCHNRACVNPQHLQIVTHQLNAENRAGAHKASATGARGVYKSSNCERYEVHVYAGGQSHRLRGFKTISEAEAAAVKLRNDLMTNNLRDRALLGDRPL